MKNKILLTIMILTAAKLLYSAPVAGVSGISGNTERASTLAQVLEQHLLTILTRNNFSAIQPEIINRELNKFSCIEEKCVLDFAENADIDLIVTGKITDKKKYITIKLESYGINIPFGKRIIDKYEVKLPMDVNISVREFSLISEEHAAVFLSRTLKVFQYPVLIKKTGDGYSIDKDMEISGKFKIYSAGEGNSIIETGNTEISKNQILETTGDIIPDKSFILVPFKNKSDDIDLYYNTRKREIVFEKQSLYDTLFLFAVTPLASATMPVSAPIFGYFMSEDWSGLGLWMISASPYLYMEARGFYYSPDKLKEKNKNLSRDDKAMNYFAWYMLAAGGMPLFMDAYTGEYIHQASYFTGVNNLLGNTATAGMLSLVSNGGGHFYRGQRYWGHFYFNLNNILLYMAMREFAVPEHYDEVTGTYTRGNMNKNRTIGFCSLFALSKTIEVIHSILARENISSGEVTDEYIIPEPLFTLDEKGNPVYGASMTLKF